MEPNDREICSHAGPAEAWGWRASPALEQDKQQQRLDQSANIAFSPAYDFHRAPSTKPAGRGDKQRRNRLILDGLVNGALFTLPATSWVRSPHMGPAFWLIVTVGGAVLLGVALAYGLISTRTRRKNRDKNRS
jgi:hypothetical protein